MTHLDSLFGLQGKVALVTGASGGLSAEAARALAKAGAAVGLVARRAERLAAVAGELATLGVATSVAPADVTDRAQIERAVDQVERELGPVDVVVHGAGIAPVRRAADKPNKSPPGPPPPLVDVNRTFCAKRRASIPCGGCRGESEKPSTARL